MGEGRFVISVLEIPEVFLKRVLKGCPVWPMYFILQVGQINCYIPRLSYLCFAWWCLVVNSLFKVLFTEKATLMQVSLKALVKDLVSLPTYVNLAQNFFWSLAPELFLFLYNFWWLRFYSRCYAWFVGWRFLSLSLLVTGGIGLTCCKDTGWLPFFVPWGDRSLPE
jgi:hypothetical protein